LAQPSVMIFTLLGRNDFVFKLLQFIPQRYHRFAGYSFPSGFAHHQGGECTPVFFSPSLFQCLFEMLSDDFGQRHRHLLACSGLLYQTNIFESEAQGKLGRFISLIQDQPTVALVGGTAEEGAGDHPIKGFGGYAVAFYQTKSFGHGFDSGSQ